MTDEPPRPRIVEDDRHAAGLAVVGLACFVWCGLTTGWVSVAFGVVGVGYVVLFAGAFIVFGPWWRR